ncbi:hypothetical protein COY28_02660 [Candidatus Woesearchaeota archaeon CG_4_10_14_0_2_um_filter_57_5]|nr:MAG: hypothetical protein COY28_02660 [Candidatus Woesearchaeota archaeon CG_4_10_14_0_2_um_filter_57_5]
MHTPDGFITSWICVIMLLPAISIIAYALNTARKWMTKDKALLMAGMAAAIFGFQMLNFSIGNGTSGHFVGAALTAILLGPEAAVLVLTAVLLVQTFVYGDGGLLTIGVNILNMGIIGSYAAHFTYRLLHRRGLRTAKGSVLSGFVAALVSVVASSLSAALLLGASGTISFAKVIPAMVYTHLFIGLGEGLITAGVLLYVLNTRAGLLHTASQLSGAGERAHAGGLARYVGLSTLGALIITAIGLPFASLSPDGLNQVALRLGFYSHAQTIYTLAPLQDYTFFGQSAYGFVLLSAAIGMALTFVVGYMIALAAQRALSAQRS